MNAINATAMCPDSAHPEPTQIHPMSDYEKFLFDLKGFLVIPNVLTDEEIRTVREHTEIYAKNPESLPEHHRTPIAGPAEFLIDHPRVMGILQEVIDPRRERIRLESIFISSRSAGNTGNQWRPHVGGTNLQPSFSYRFHNGRIYSGMTRIVWELNEVKKGQGGTCLVPGSHKANLASAQDGTCLSKQTILTREFGRPMDVRREASSCSQKACGTRGLIGQIQTTLASPS